MADHGSEDVTIDIASTHYECSPKNGAQVLLAIRSTFAHGSLHSGRTEVRQIPIRLRSPAAELDSNISKYCLRYLMNDARRGQRDWSLSVSLPEVLLSCTGATAFEIQTEELSKSLCA